MGADLRTPQTIQCPNNKRCRIFPSPPGWTESDFAICSEQCDMYKGMPAVHVSTQPGSVSVANGAVQKDPYPNVAISENLPTSPSSPTAWRVSDSDVWYFDVHGGLTRSSASGSTTPVSAEQWTPKSSNCTGEVSASMPKRFLATCVGAHFYTDGDLDAIFGYSRIALFDVTRRQLLVRIDGPAYTSAALSPNGRRIATIHRGSQAKVEVKLYSAD